ncbi:MAG: cytochrome b [Chromatiales bacterium]|jgi:cytochrome b561|nr:MAG: cytochrome b [Chromatiales bacterium]
MLKDTATAWGSMTRATHWILVLIVAVQIPLGFWMVDLIEDNIASQGDDPWIMLTANVHHTIGFLVLILAFWRINWRLNNPTPELPASRSAYELYLARITQGFLYFLMFFYPLTGWAVLSTSPDELPILFFGWEIPRMVSAQSEGTTFASDLFSELHLACWKAGGALLLLHVSGATWHQFIRRDDLLMRMWRGHG